MNLNEYQEKAMTTCMDSSNNMTYAIYGLLGEVGELLEKVGGLEDLDQVDLVKSLLDCGNLAKAVRKEQIPSVEHEVKDLLGFYKEIGDIAWFLALISKINSISLDEVCQMNISKLADRKKRSAIDGDGDSR